MDIPQSSGSEYPVSPDVSLAVSPNTLSSTTNENGYVTPQPDESSQVASATTPPLPPPVPLPESGDKLVRVSDPIDALSSNREQTRIVAAGSRGVLKIFRISDTSIDHVHDIRSGKGRRNVLIYSPSNVAWNKLRDEYIATSSTSGAVVLFDVHKSKMVRHYKVHTRSATVVDFHRSDENLMISGSKDASMFLYDLRMEEPVRRFSFRSGIYETVRDISFCPTQGLHDKFLSADDGGVVKVWDLRNTDNALASFQPHTGYVSSIALNPNEPHLVASGGGRDKLIKVWDWKNPGRESRWRPMYQVETIAPVGRVYWRPDHSWQIATCAVVNDMSILVWDIRRPYFPVVSFTGHRDSVTDVWWSRSHPHRFVSSGKDGHLILHKFPEQGLRSLDFMCDSQIAVAPDGLLAITINGDNDLKNAPKWDTNRATLQLKMEKGKPPSRQTIAASRRRAMYDPFRGPIPSRIAVGIPDTAEKSLRPNLFYQLAEDFKLGDLPLQDLCAHNAFAATLRGDARRAQIWRHVRILLSFTDFQETYNKEAEELLAKEQRRWEIYVREHESQNLIPLLPPKPLPNIPFCLLSGQKARKWRGSRNSAFHSARDPTEFLGAHSDRFLDKNNGQLRPQDLESEIPKCDEFMGLPTEAFSKRRALTGSGEEPFELEPGWIVPSYRPDSDPVKILKRTLDYLAAQGDVQMCASIATVVGHRLSETVSNFQVEAWLHSYMEMLNRLELYSTVAALHKWTWIRRLQLKTTEGTYLKETVTHVRPITGSEVPQFEAPNEKNYICTGMVKNGRCDSCTSAIMPVCVLCDTAIVGQLWNCQKCHHSMHVDHAVAWFQREYEYVSTTDSSETEEEDPPTKRTDSVLTFNEEDQASEVLDDSDSDICEEEFEVYTGPKANGHHRGIRLEDRSNNHCPVSWCTCRCNVRHDETFDFSAFNEGHDVPPLSTPTTRRVAARTDAVRNQKGNVFAMSSAYDIGLRKEEAGNLDIISTGLLEQNDKESRLLHNAFLASKVVEAPLRDSWCSFFDPQKEDSSDFDSETDEYYRRRVKQQVQLDRWMERQNPDDLDPAPIDDDLPSREPPNLENVDSWDFAEENDSSDREREADTEESEGEFGGILRYERRKQRKLKLAMKEVNNVIYGSALGKEMYFLPDSPVKEKKSNLRVRRRTKFFSTPSTPVRSFPTSDPIPVNLISQHVKAKREQAIQALHDAAMAARRALSPSPAFVNDYSI